MYKAIIIILFILLIMFYGLRAVQAQTNNFTCQGSLKDGAIAASGNFDVTVEIYDADTGGNLVGSTNITNVAVVNGIHDRERCSRQYAIQRARLFDSAELGQRR